MHHCKTNCFNFRIYLKKKKLEVDFYCHQNSLYFLIRICIWSFYLLYFYSTNFCNIYTYGSHLVCSLFRFRFIIVQMSIFPQHWYWVVLNITISRKVNNELHRISSSWSLILSCFKIIIQIKSNFFGYSSVIIKGNSYMKYIINIKYNGYLSSFSI